MNQPRADTGFAVYVKGSLTGQPVAIFAYADHAYAWGKQNFCDRHSIEELKWMPSPSKELKP